MFKYIFLLWIMLLPLSSFANLRSCDVNVHIKSYKYANTNRIMFNMINAKTGESYRNIVFAGQDGVIIGNVPCDADYNIYATPLDNPRDKETYFHGKLKYINNPISLNDSINISYPYTFVTNK